MKTEKLLRQAVIGLIFLVPFIPLIVANQFFFPFITGKNFAFRILVEIAFGLWVLLALRDPSLRPRRSALLGALLLFIATLGVSTLLAENPSKSFWSNFERMEGWISVIHWGAYFLIVSSTFAGEKLWRWFWNVSIGASVILGIYGLFQLGGALPINQGGVRVDATFGNATYLAVYMLFSAFMTILALLRWSPGALMKGFYGVALVLQLIMIFYTATRGTILGLVGGLFLTGLIFLIFGKGMKTLRAWGIGAVVAVLVLVGGFMLAKDSSFIRDNEVLARFASISFSEASTRFSIWSMAARGALERPVFGWGQEGFNHLFNKYYEPYLYKQEQWFDRAHNQFLDWLVAGGFFGFVLYASFYLILLWYIWRKPALSANATPGAKPATPEPAFDLIERAVLTGLLAGYAFHNLFVFDNLMSSILFLSLMGYIAARAVPRDASEKGAPLSGPMLSGASLGVAVATLLVVYAVNVPGMARASALIEGLTPTCSNEQGVKTPCRNARGEPVPGAKTDIPLNFDAFKRAVSGGGLGRQEAHEQLMQFAIELGSSQNLIAATTPEFRSSVFSYTVRALADEVEKEPNDARVQFFYAAFLHQIGDLVGAEAPLMKAHELSPKKQTILFELGLLAFDRGDTAGALEWMKTAFELEPSYDQARIYYAMIAIKSGRRDLAEALLKERYGTAIPDNDYILQAYNDIKDNAAVVAILEARVAARPDDAQLRLNLAAAYLQAGRRADSIASIREAIRLNQSFAPQGEEYIRIIESGQNP